MNLMRHFNHIFHDFRCRSNRIRSHETGSCGNSAERGRFIPKQVQLVFLFRNGQFPQLYPLHGSDSRVITLLENLFIFIDDRFPFFRKTFRNKAVERRFRKPEQSCAHTKSGNIFHLHGSVLLAISVMGSGRKIRPVCASHFGLKASSAIITPPSQISFP